MTTIEDKVVSEKIEQLLEIVRPLNAVDAELTMGAAYAYVVTMIHGLHEGKSEKEIAFHIGESYAIWCSSVKPHYPELNRKH